MLVVDACYAVQACLAEDAFTPLGDPDLVAPPLWWSEVCSALHQLGWHGHITATLATDALQRLRTAPVSCRSPETLLEEAWQVADKLGWARTYGAEYVALARLLDCPLLTLDERLRRGAARAVKVIGPTEL